MRTCVCNLSQFAQSAKTGEGGPWRTSQFNPPVCAGADTQPHCVLPECVFVEQQHSKMTLQYQIASGGEKWTKLHTPMNTQQGDALYIVYSVHSLPCLIAPPPSLPFAFRSERQAHEHQDFQQPRVSQYASMDANHTGYLQRRHLLGLIRGFSPSKPNCSFPS